MSTLIERWKRPAIDELTHWMIRRAAQRAPEHLSGRLEEEWLADLASHSSARSQVRFAAGCWWAAVVISHELAHDVIPVPAPPAAIRASMTFADRNAGYLSLRAGTLFLIIGLYAALFGGLASPLAQTAAPQDVQSHAQSPAQR